MSEKEISQELRGRVIHARNIEEVRDILGLETTEGKAEQVCVCVAVQRGYMSQSGVGRRGGLTFYEQWQTAFAARPKVVSITWWNEWAAQRFIVNGESAFVDNYSPEYSRDIEPMEGGHGDTYYRWMKEYIAAYKAGKECPRLVTDG